MWEKGLGPALNLTFPNGPRSLLRNWPGFALLQEPLKSLGMIRNHRLGPHHPTRMMGRLAANSFFSEEEEEEEWMWGWKWEPVTSEAGGTEKPHGLRVGQDRGAVRLKGTLSWFSFLILHVNDISHVHKQAVQGDVCQLGPLPM